VPLLRWRKPTTLWNKAGPLPKLALKRPAVAPAEGLLTEAVLRHARVVPASSPTALASLSVCTALPNGASGRLAARRWQEM
jgi:hypothetical protein